MRNLMREPGWVSIWDNAKYRMANAELGERRMLAGVIAKLGIRHPAFAILLSLVMAAALPSPAAENADPVIVLPPLEVSAALQTTPWRYAELPGAEILSSCSESTTKAFITAEYRVEQLFGLLIPAEFRVKLAVPKIIVLSEQKRTLNA